MDVSDFDYSLPSHLIAADPPERRDDSRLMLMNRGNGALRHSRFRDLSGELQPGDCLVLNDSRVIPARLHGYREGGGKVEFLLLSPADSGAWTALAKPARKLRPGERILLEGAAPGIAAASVVVRAVAEGGVRVIELHSVLPPSEILEHYGRMPLPPYIVAARKSRDETRDKGEHESATAREARDRERYQTVYADAPGSVAAPTAGLHFTKPLLEHLARRGVEIQAITLHVGAGTFAPLKTDRVEDHVMHEEVYEISEEAARGIDEARIDPDRRVIAVGTTVARSLESCMIRESRITPIRESTGLMITPGFEFRVIDALLTNFHLPRSTLLMLVSAFAGKENILAAYEEAVRLNYRFYSYGDAMLIS